MTNFLNMQLIFFFSNFFRLLSYKNTVRFVFLCMPLIKIFAKKKYKIFYSNHRNAFPEKSRAEIRKQALGSLKSMYINYAITIKYFKYKNFDKAIMKAFHDSLPDFEKIDRSKKSVIYFSSHMGISVLGPYLYSKHFKVESVVPLRPYQNSKIAERIINSYRNEYCEIVELGGSLPRVEEVLKNGGAAFFGMDLVLDTKYKTKVKFFNKDFEMVNSIVWLAKNFDTLVVPVMGTLDEDYNPIIKVFEPIDMNSKEPMQLIATAIEDMIKTHPQNWNLADRYFV